MTPKGEQLSTRQLKKLHGLQSGAIRARLKDFNGISPAQYFYELVYCLLTPQSSAVNADKAVRALQRDNFQNASIDPEPLLHHQEYYIRFHKTKAKRLIAMKESYADLFPHLTNGSSSIELRAWLVKNVKGIGWKEASHFLRNIGHRNLAILDRHILKNLVRVGAISSVPKSLTEKRYLEVERKFMSFSRKTGIPMDELDLLFWSLETGKILK